MTTTKPIPAHHVELKQKLEAIGNGAFKFIRVSTGVFYVGDDAYFIKVDFLDKKDHPHGIEENSIYISFYVEAGKVELRNCGHVSLSKEDKESDQYKYYAAKRITKVHEDFGGKKFRKCKFKSIEDLSQKIGGYCLEVLDSVKKYTGSEYPYDALI